MNTHPHPLIKNNICCLSKGHFQLIAITRLTYILCLNSVNQNGGNSMHFVCISICSVNTAGVHKRKHPYYLHQLCSQALRKNNMMQCVFLSNFIKRTLKSIISEQNDISLWKHKYVDLKTV